MKDTPCIVMPVMDYIKEHKNLIGVLESGKRDARMKEAAKQEAEMKRMLSTPGGNKAMCMMERPKNMKRTHDSAMMHMY
jgi:hypothetical protein